MTLSQEPKPKLSTFTILYIIAVFLAFAIRLLNLGKAPLSDTEAGWALQALEVARGNTPTIGAQPAYVLITGVLFAIFKESNSLSRLLPALAGSALVLLPIFLSVFFTPSERLRRAVIVLAFGLALDPSLVAASRTAGSNLPALTFTIFALSLYLRRKYWLAGILTGLALLSGPGVFSGITGIGLAYALSRIIKYKSKFEISGLGIDSDDTLRSGVKKWAVSILVTLGCSSTLFLVLPQGLAGFGGMISAYLHGWVTPSGIPSLRLLASLLVYQPLVVLMGVIGIAFSWLPGIIQSEEDSTHETKIKKIGQVCSLWLVSALLVSLLYPGRAMEDLLWALIPFWILAAIELSRYLTADPQNIFLPAAAGLAALTSLFWLMIWYNLLRLNVFQADLTYYLILVGSIFLMAIIISILVSAGWSAHTALHGLIWGLSLILVIYTIFQTWGVSQLRPNSPRELWHQGPATNQADLLLRTLTDLSTWDTGMQHELEITVTADLPSLRWALRQFSHSDFKPILDEQELSPVIITPGEVTSPNLVASYRGQDFIWQVSAGWSKAIPPGNLIRWIAFREAPEISHRMILWVRNDLFPGGWLEPTSSEKSEQEFIPPVEEDLIPQDIVPID